MPSIICINRRGGIKDEEGVYRGPFEPVQVSERYYQRRYLRDRHTYTVEDYEYHLAHVWKEGTIRQIAKNAGLPHEEPVEVLRELLSTKQSEVEPLEEPDEEDLRAALVLALGEDDYHEVGRILREVTGSSAPKGKDDRYGLAQRLLDGEEEG